MRWRRYLTDPHHTVLYDKYKEYRDAFENSHKSDVILKVPPHLDLELNTTCNLKCEFCFHSFDSPKPEYMSLDTAIQCLGEFSSKGGYSVKFNYRGEPMMAKILNICVEYAKIRGLYTMINTNGILSGFSDLYGALDLIIFSVDDGHKNTYKKEWELPYEIIINEIKNLCKQPIRPKIRVQAVIPEWSDSYANDYVIEWKPYVDEIAINIALDEQDTTEDDTMIHFWRCSQLWQRLVILADGQVQCCCGVPDPDKIVGNIKDNTIEEIWHNKKMKHLRYLHSTGKSHRIAMCRRCPLRKYVIKNT